MSEIAPIESSIGVSVDADSAFSAFTESFGAWWPAEYTWSQLALLQSIGMECRLGGLMTEIGPHGFRIDWGRIVGWEPPRSMRFLWQISSYRQPVPDPEQASTVLVSFEGAEERSHMKVKHDGWHHHGPDGAKYRDAFQDAWPTALARFAQYVDSRGALTR